MILIDNERQQAARQNLFIATERKELVTYKPLTPSQIIQMAKLVERGASKQSVWKFVAPQARKQDVYAALDGVEWKR